MIHKHITDEFEVDYSKSSKVFSANKFLGIPPP